MTSSNRAGARCTELIGPNPFEFRAGICSGEEVRTCQVFLVLIPLNSGLVFVHRQGIGDARQGIVLIPLNSGLVFVHLPEHMVVAANVLIPLNSGLVFVPELRAMLIEARQS